MTKAFNFVFSESSGFKVFYNKVAGEKSNAVAGKNRPDDNMQIVICYHVAELPHITAYCPKIRFQKVIKVNESQGC